ncbi:MAG: hypothetical protein K0R92_432 [Lachnospiraceae bacterium]|nr:hypothetical protein [Lachnospiraceae bacterium]
MEFTGVITDISNNIITGSVNITFSVNEKSLILPEYERLKNIKKLKITAAQYREKRSLDANAYMWVLLQKLAEVLHTTKDELYIDMLGKYGVFTHIIVKPHVVARVKEEWRTVKELGEVTVGGQTGIQLQCYFGSSTYDTKEMSVLIDGVVQECKDEGIETLPPDELARMKKEWGV